MTTRRGARALAAVLGVMLLAGCALGAPARTTSAVAGTMSITLYTCANDATAEAVVKGFQSEHAGVKVDVYQATTGDLNARVGADVAAGGLQADVIWACDPLTMQDYVTQGLVGGWTPDTKIPAEARTSDYVGAAMLYVVAVGRHGSALPATWEQLANSGKVVIPDPTVAAAALGALGYFGVPFYATLKRRGAVQVSTPDEVARGVALGTYDVGMTTATSADAAAEGHPDLAVSWPRPGAVAIYAPVALSKSTKNVDAAQAFISYLTSKDGQTAIGASGAYPTLAGIAGPTKPDNAPVVYPDWTALASRKASLLSNYAKVFGG